MKTNQTNQTPAARVVSAPVHMPTLRWRLAIQSGIKTLSDRKRPYSDLKLPRDFQGVFQDVPLYDGRQNYLGSFMVVVAETGKPSRNGYSRGSFPHRIMVSHKGRLIPAGRLAQARD